MLNTVVMGLNMSDTGSVGSRDFFYGPRRARLGLLVGVRISRAGSSVPTLAVTS
jgi:hypothetical protein